MTIEHIMLLASVAQTPRDWAEVRAAILALIDEARNDEAQECAGLCAYLWTRAEVTADDCANAIQTRIRARIAASVRRNEKNTEHC
jgi:hypothetical protein